VLSVGKGFRQGKSQKEDECRDDTPLMNNPLLRGIWVHRANFQLILVVTLSQKNASILLSFL